jgi:hypothetical protein
VNKNKDLCSLCCIVILSSSNWIGKPDGAILLGAISSLSGAVEPIEIEMKPPKVDLDIVGSC